MKRYFFVLSAMLLFTFGAGCTPGIPTDTDASGDTSAVEQTHPDQVQPDETSPVYFVLDGMLAGSWENGVWHSLNDIDGRYEDAYSNVFYFKDILGAPRFTLYSREGKLGHTDFALVNADSGLGGFEEDRTAIFAPHARQDAGGAWPHTMEITLPVKAGPELASLAVPFYGYSLRFSYAGAALATNSARDLNPYPQKTWTDAPQAWADDRDIGAIKERLAANGISGEVHINDLLLLKTDKGREERLLFANTPVDTDGYLRLSPGDGGNYSVVLWRRADGSYETVYERYQSYTDDVTAHFQAEAIGVYDLNGLGADEVCIRVAEWEGGHTLVCSRDTGAWAVVLRANWGS